MVRASRPISPSSTSPCDAADVATGLALTHDGRQTHTPSGASSPDTAGIRPPDNPTSSTQPIALVAAWTRRAGRRSRVRQ